MYRRSASKNPRKDSAGFYTLRGRKFPYGNFRTTLERPTVRSCLSVKLEFRDSLLHGLHNTHAAKIVKNRHMPALLYRAKRI